MQPKHKTAKCLPVKWFSPSKITPTTPTPLITPLQSYLHSQSNPQNSLRRGYSICKVAFKVVAMVWVVWVVWRAVKVLDVEISHYRGVVVGEVVSRKVSHGRRGEFLRVVAQPQIIIKTMIKKTMSTSLDHREMEGSTGGLWVWGTKLWTSQKELEAMPLTPQFTKMTKKVITADEEEVRIRIRIRLRNWIAF